MLFGLMQLRSMSFFGHLVVIFGTTFWVFTNTYFFCLENMADIGDLNKKFERECHVDDFFMNEADDVDDDWFYDSIRRYKHLLMYDLARPATALEICDPQTLCVSLTSATGSNAKTELLTLSVPAKLHTTNEAEEGLCKHRDFEVVSGTAVNYVISEICPLPGSSTIAFSGPFGSSVMKSNNNTGTIKEETTLSQSSPQSKLAVSSLTLAAGTLSNSIRTYVLGNYTAVQTVKLSEDCETLSAIKYADENTIMACGSSSGKLFRSDTRDDRKCDTQNTHLDETNGMYWTFDVHKESFLVGQLNSEGHVFLKDLRKCDSTVSEYKLPSEARDLSENIKIRFSPCGSMFSVSGFDDTVIVYSVSCNTKPLFVHDGHKRPTGGAETNVITSHVWHPVIPNLIFSSSKNNSFQAWQFETCF